MIYIANVIRSTINNAYRIIQVSLFKRAREVKQSLPYGIDSAPTNDMVAIYAQSNDLNNSVVIGYVYKDAIAEIGSVRLYSENGYVHLRASGDIELGGTADNAMRFAAFDSVMQSYLTALNAAISTGIGSAGGAYTPPTAPNFTSAKIDKIKTL